MSGISVGELVKRAKGEDRSLREYARDSGVDAAILSKMINEAKKEVYKNLIVFRISVAAVVCAALNMYVSGKKPGSKGSRT